MPTHESETLLERYTREAEVDKALLRHTLPALPAAKVLASGMINGKWVELRGWHEDDLKAWADKHGFVFDA